MSITTGPERPGDGGGRGSSSGARLQADDRRAARRWVLARPLAGFLKGRVPTSVLDISRRGALVEVWVPFRIGTSCELAIPFPSAKFAAVARVRRLVYRGTGLDADGRAAVRHHVALEFEAVPGRILDLLEHETKLLRGW